MSLELKDISLLKPSPEAPDEHRRYDYTSLRLPKKELNFANEQPDLTISTTK